MAGKFISSIFAGKQISACRSSSYVGERIFLQGLYWGGGVVKYTDYARNSVPKGILDNEKSEKSLRGYVRTAFPCRYWLILDDN